jgi:hypothetical protein
LDEKDLKFKLKEKVCKECVQCNVCGKTHSLPLCGCLVCGCKVSITARDKYTKEILPDTDIVLINSFIPLVNLIGDLVAAIPIVLLIIILEIKLFLFLGILIAILFILYDKFIKKKLPFK